MDITLLSKQVKSCIIALLFLCFAQIGTAQTPVSINGQLKVINSQLCNQYNTPIQLRGMSTHGIQWFGWNDCLTEASLDVLAYNWGSDILRISMYVQEGGYESNPTSFTNQVKTLVNEATDRGMYALIDFHQLSPGDPNYNTSNATTFFTDVANEFKGYNNVIYDIANEPNGVTWNTIKSYADQLIPVIRNIDDDAVILCGTHGWASFGVSDGKTVQDIINNPVTIDDNFMYTFHFYAASHGANYLNMLKTGVNAGLPIFVTEFGSQNAAGEGADDFNMTDQYLDYLALKKISWCNWNFSDDNRSGAVWNVGTCNGADWSDSKLKAAGVYIKDKMLNPADDFGLTGPVDCNGDVNGTAYTDNCNKCVGGNTTKIGYASNGIFDNITLTEDSMGGFDGGLYYWDLPTGTVNYPNFVAVKNRDINSNEQQYTITQPAGEYTPIGLSFGTVSSVGPSFGNKSTVDLTNDAKLSITFTNHSNTDVTVAIAISDSLGKLLDHTSGASVVNNANFLNEAYKYAISMEVTANSTKSQTFDFAGAYHANYTSENMEQDCDIKLISGINLTITNANVDGNYAPLLLSNALVSIDELKLGDPGPETPCIITNSTSTQKEIKLGIFPNPVQDALFFNDTQLKTITVVNVNGKTVFQGKVSNELSVSNLAPGVYYIVDAKSLKNNVFIKK